MLTKKLLKKTDTKKEQDVILYLISKMNTLNINNHKYLQVNIIQIHHRITISNKIV